MKHFIFDMGGVLAKTIPLELIKDEISYVDCPTEELKKTFLRHFLDYEKGNLDTADYVRKLQPLFNKTDLTAVEFEQNYYSIEKKYGGVYPDAYVCLKTIKNSGHKIYLLSNIHEIAYKNFSNVFDVSIFDELFLSFQMSTIKPEKQIYQNVIEKINDSPSNIYFFDDTVANIKIASACGINAIQTTGDTLKENISKVIKSF